jgi:hypothetical protein
MLVQWYLNLTPFSIPPKIEEGVLLRPLLIVKKATSAE